jgi:hypothetical protein
MSWTTSPPKIGEDRREGATWSVLREKLDRAAPHITYWPTLRTSDYDQMANGVS